MAFLPLSQGYVAIVDDEDLPRLKKFKWHIHRHRKNAGLYASRYYHPKNARRTNRKLEYEVLNLPQPLPKGHCVDHINRDTLDNRKKNLRLCTIQQNNLNKPPYKHKASSIYKGVYYDKKRDRWTAQLDSKNKHYYLGRYKNEYHAMHVYNLAAINHHGRFAYLNQWIGPSPGHTCPFSKNLYNWFKKQDSDFQIPTGPYSSQKQKHKKPPGIQLQFNFKD